MSARDFADLSRERAEDDLHGDEYRRRAMERADRLREVSDLPEMGEPFVSVERVRPAVRNDQEAVAPMRGLLIGVLIGTGLWAAVVAIAEVAA